MDQGATSAAMSYSRRRDAATTNVTAGGPTLRRTAAPQTHATQHGRQRRRTRHRPTDSLQLSQLTSVGSFTLTCRPRRLANHKFAPLTHSQHAVSVRPYSHLRISSIRTADDDKTCVSHDFSPLNELFSRNSRQPRGTHMTG